MLTEKQALAVMSRSYPDTGKYLVDARSSEDGSVLVYINDEKELSYQLGIVVKKLK